MRRNFGVGFNHRLGTVLCGLLLLLFCLQASEAYAKPLADDLGKIPGQARSRFSFIVGSDSHIGYLVGNRFTALCLSNIETERRNPAFMIHMGDLTETGSLSEYTTFQEFFSHITFPLFATPGNHESRWQDKNGGIFSSNFGLSNYSFDYGSWHFVVLDTTFPGQTYGSVDPAVWEWLETDLSSQPSGRQIAIFSHHPLLYKPQAFQDSDDTFRKIVDKYPVKVVFSGHGHSFIHWQTQGIDCFMVGALMDGAFAEVKVNGNKMTVNRVQVKENGQAEEFQVFEVGSSLAKNPLSDLSTTVSTDKVSSEFTLERPSEMWVQIDQGTFNLLGNFEAGTYTVTQDLSDYEPGLHTLRLKAIDSESEFVSSVEFEKDAGLISWRSDLESAMVGNLVHDKDSVIVGTRDGRIAKIHSSNGHVDWQYHVGSIWGGGTVNSGRIYFGTSDGEFYCLRSHNGTMAWKTTVRSESFSAPPLIAMTSLGETAFIGSDSGKMYAFNTKTGRIRWTFQGNGAIVSAPTLGNKILSFGAWDGNLYGVNVKDGTLAWKIPLGRQVYYSPYHSPVYSDRMFYTTTPYDAHAEGSLLVAVNPKDGSIVWKSSNTSSLSGLKKTTSPENLIAMNGYGNILTFGKQGEIASTLQGASSLFAAPVNSGDVYITGGSRGVITIITPQGRYNYKVRDSRLFIDPLLATSKTTPENTLVIVADTRGTLWAITVPDTPSE